MPFQAMRHPSAIYWQGFKKLLSMRPGRRLAEVRASGWIFCADGFDGGSTCQLMDRGTVVALPKIQYIGAFRRYHDLQRKNLYVLKVLEPVVPGPGFGRRLSSQSGHWKDYCRLTTYTPIADIHKIIADVENIYLLYLFFKTYVPIGCSFKSFYKKIYKCSDTLRKMTCLRINCICIYMRCLIIIE